MEDNNKKDRPNWIDEIEIAGDQLVSKVKELLKEGNVRNTKTEYISRTTEFKMDGGKCKLCQQCIKACPHGALVMPPRPPRGVKLPIYDRMPKFPDAKKCVFCGICMNVLVMAWQLPR